MENIKNQDLEMYFTVNLAFLDHLGKLNEEIIESPIKRNWTHEKQILPISLESVKINSSLLWAPKHLKNTQTGIRKEKYAHPRSGK